MKARADQKKSKWFACARRRTHFAFATHKMASHEPNKHYDTPQQAKIQGAVEFLKAKGIEIPPRVVFEFFGAKQTQGYSILQGESRTRHNQEGNETRGRPLKLTGAQVCEADSILEEENLGVEGKRYTWPQLAIEVGADVSGITMRRTMRAALGYHKCLACVRGWLDEHMSER